MLALGDSSFRHVDFSCKTNNFIRQINTKIIEGKSRMNATMINYT